MPQRKHTSPMVLEHIQSSRRLVDQAYEIMRQAIITWKIPPGNRLYQIELASGIGVSQMIIREALSRLEAEGLVVREPYKGIRTTPFTAHDIEDLYRLRLLLEGDAFELAASRITREDISRLKLMLPKVVYNPEEPESLDQARLEHRAFHFIIYNASCCKYLIRFISQVWNLIDPYLLYSPNLSKSMTREALRKSTQSDLVSHSRLIEALEAGDPEKSREASNLHILGGLESLEEAIRFVTG